jgi:hypothetical protein
MAAPVLAVRVAGNIDELRRNLKEGRDQIEVTTAAMSKLATSLSGEKVTQQAHNIVAAINQIGGATNLSASQAEFYAGKLNLAIEQAERMGKTVPAAWRSTHTELVKVSEATGGLTGKIDGVIGTMRNIAGAVGIGFGISAIVNFGKSVFDAASQAKDLSDRLGTSIEFAQRMSFAAGQTGTTVEKVSTAITQLNNRLAEGGKGTIDALKAAGLQFDAIRAMQPEEAFTAIADAIQKIPDPMRQTQIAMDLFGKSGAELLPAIKEGFSEIAAGAAVMSEETVRRLEAAQDSWESFWNSIVVHSGEAIGKIVEWREETRRMAEEFDEDFKEDPAERTRKLNAAIAAQIGTMEGAIHAASGYGAGIKGLEPPHVDLIKVMKEADEAAKALKEKLEKQAKATEEAARAAKHLQDELDRKGLRELGRTMALDEFNRDLAIGRDRLQAIEIAFYEQRAAVAAAGVTMQGYGVQVRTLSSVDLPKLGLAVSSLSPFLDEQKKKADENRDAFMRLGGAFGELASMSSGSMSIVFSSFQHGIAGAMNFASAVKQVEGMSLSSFASIAQAAASAIGMIGALSSAASAINVALGGTGRAANDLRDNFLRGFPGGMSGLTAAIGQMGNDPALMAAFQQFSTAGTSIAVGQAYQQLIARLGQLGWSGPGSTGTGGGGGGGFLPGEGGGPHLGQGGIVTRPTRALIGESGPEAVIPLNSAGGVGNTYQIYISAVDAPSFQSWMRRGGAREIVIGITPELQRQGLA